MQLCFDSHYIFGQYMSIFIIERLMVSLPIILWWSNMHLTTNTFLAWFIKECGFKKQVVYFQRVDIDTPARWLTSNGKPPLDVPACGFLGEECTGGKYTFYHLKMLPCIKWVRLTLNYYTYLLISWYKGVFIFGVHSTWCSHRRWGGCRRGHLHCSNRRILCIQVRMTAYLIRCLNTSDCSYIH
jgi:hypothetical protein